MYQDLLSIVIDLSNVISVKSRIVLSSLFWNIFQEVSELQLDHKALYIVYSGSIKSKVQYMYQTCVLNSWRVGLCIRSVRQMFTWHWPLLNTSLLLNNHVQFQNKHGEEMSPIKKVMTQYVQVMLNLCLTVYK